MTSRGRLMVSLLSKKDETSIESTDTETSNQMDIYTKRDRGQFELLNGDELINFKRKLRRRSCPIRYPCSEDGNGGDFSPDELSEEYLPPQPQGLRVQSDSDCSVVLGQVLQELAEDDTMEINSFITLSDLGVGLASGHYNSYICLDSDFTAVADVIGDKETTRNDCSVGPTSTPKQSLCLVEIVEDNSIGSKSLINIPNVAAATTETLHPEPASSDLLSIDVSSSSPEKREPGIPTDFCSINSSQRNASLPSSSRNIQAVSMTEALHQELAPSDILASDVPSCSPERRDPDIATDSCSIDSPQRNTSPCSSFRNLEASPMNEVLHQEPAPSDIIINVSSLSLDRHATEVLTDPCSISSSHRNECLPSTSSSHETDVSKKRVYPIKKTSGRKRQRDPQNWKMNRLKTLRNSGLEYTNKNGKVVRERALGPGCNTDKDCKRKCHTNICNDHRNKMFKQFWAMGNHDKQVEYLSRFITRVQRKTVQLDNINSRRHCTYEYYLPVLGEKIRVCKKMFLDTFNITDMWITTMFKKIDESSEEVISNDRRGKHRNRGNAIDENTKISVRQHINSIPIKESHYVRQRTSKLYFEESLTFPRLYSLYEEWMTENKPNDAKATKEQYRQIFYKEFNIDFFKPKKDQCLKCEVHLKASELEKQTTASEYALHLANKCIIRQIKENDKAEAQRLKKTLLTACYDLQKILTTPQSDVSTFYYKRKFHVFNFTIFDIGSAEGHCYVWDECVGKKGPNEIASFLFDFIKKKAAEGIKEFRFYSDCCGGQNRNRIVFLMYAYASKTFGVNIAHNFFEVGHSQSEGDSMHALIERRKKNQVVYVPQQWYTLIRCAKTTGKSYAVKEVNQNDIFNFKSLLNLVPNWELDSNKIKVMWSKVIVIKIDSQNPNIIHFQNDYYSDRQNFIDLDYHKVQTRRQNKNKCLSVLWDHNLPLAYESLHPITQSKYKDLHSLCSSGAIPEQYKSFYVNLPHSNTVCHGSDIEN